MPRSRLFNRAVRVERPATSAGSREQGGSNEDRSYSNPRANFGRGRRRSRSGRYASRTSRRRRRQLHERKSLRSAEGLRQGLPLPRNGSVGGAGQPPSLLAPGLRALAAASVCFGRRRIRAGPQGGRRQEGQETPRRND